MHPVVQKTIILVLHVVYSHTTEALAQAVPQQPRIHAAVAAGPALATSGVLCKLTNTKKSRMNVNLRLLNGFIFLAVTVLVGVLPLSE